MHCPHCRAELKTYPYHHFTVDFCPTCGGLWFDPGEMREYIQLCLQDNPNLCKEKINLQQTVANINRLPEPAYLCPHCHISMEKVNYSYDSNVIIDKCPKCCGIWVHRGEIERIVRYTNQNQTGLEYSPEALEREKQAGLLIEIADTLDTLLQKPRLILALLTGSALPVDDVPVRKFPWVTAGIIGLNVMIFFYQNIFISNLSSYFKSFSLIPAAIASGSKGYALITSMFIHVNLLHLLGNMVFLWVFGDNVEDSLGHMKYLISFLVFGIFATFTHCLIEFGSQIPSMGASGAVSGILGAYLILFPRAKITLLLKYRPVDVPAWFYLGTWILFQNMNALLFATPGFSTGVAWFTHIGGFLAGVLLMIWHKRDEVMKSRQASFEMEKDKIISN